MNLRWGILWRVDRRLFLSFSAPRISFFRYGRCWGQSSGWDLYWDSLGNTSISSISLLASLHNVHNIQSSLDAAVTSPTRSPYLSDIYRCSPHNLKGDLLIHITSDKVRRGTSHPYGFTIKAYESRIDRNQLSVNSSHLCIIFSFLF